MTVSEVFKTISKYCNENLLKNNVVLNYLLEERKLTLESILQWELGLFPQNLRELFEIADPKELREASIVRNASNSMFQSHDVVMPIKDVYGNYIALSGRTRMPDEDREKKKIPKYLNSIYHKTHHLFGLNFAKEDVLKKNIVYVVEGYYDVITPHQKGFKNIVATCGAYLSTRHLTLLSRYTNNIVLFLDNEDTAQERAQKIVEKKKREGLNLTRICPLPEGEKDIDQYLRGHHLSEFLDLLK